MDIKTAEKMMHDAVRAMVDCGRFKAAQVVAVRSLVAGRHEDAKVLLLGETVEALQVYAQRLTIVGTQDLVGFNPSAYDGEEIVNLRTDLYTAN